NPLFVQYMVNDAVGITDVGAQKLSRRELADVARTVEKQLEIGVAFAEIEKDYAHHLLTAARAINQALRSQTPPRALEWIQRLGVPQTDYSAPPAYARILGSELEADSNASYDPHELFFLPWFDPWFL